MSLILLTDRELCDDEEQHTEYDRQTKTWRRGGDQEELVEFPKVNGTVGLRMRCSTCGTHNLDDIAQARAAAWGLTVRGRLTPRVRTSLGPCSVKGCEETNVELHHFAPRNTFGEECDDWPVSALCVPHHREWHTRMDGYRWHRPAA